MIPLLLSIYLNGPDGLLFRENKDGRRTPVRGKSPPPVNGRVSWNAPAESVRAPAIPSPRVDEVNRGVGVPKIGAIITALSARLATRSGVHGVAVVQIGARVGLHKGHPPGGQQDAGQNDNACPELGVLFCGMMAGCSNDLLSSAATLFILRIRSHRNGGSGITRSGTILYPDRVHFAENPRFFRKSGTPGAGRFFEMGWFDGGGGTAAKRCSYSVVSPVLTANLVKAATLCRSSFFMMCFLCVGTVSLLGFICSEICLVVKPSLMSRTTSRSRRLSSGWLRPGSDRSDLARVDGCRTTLSKTQCAQINCPSTPDNNTRMGNLSRTKRHPPREG